MAGIRGPLLPPPYFCVVSLLPGNPTTRRTKPAVPSLFLLVLRPFTLAASLTTLDGRLRLDLCLAFRYRHPPMSRDSDTLATGYRLTPRYRRLFSAIASCSLSRLASLFGFSLVRED